MHPRACLVFALLAAFLSCKPAEESHQKVIIGAVLIDGAGGPPLSDSVVVVGSGQILAAGRRSTVPIPGEANKIDGAGRFLVPGIVDICASADPPGLVHPNTAEEARTQVSALTTRKAPAIYLGKTSPAIAAVVFEAARSAGTPVIVQFSTQAEARMLVEGGAGGLIGMIVDTEDLDSALVTRLRDLRIVVAPALVKAGSNLEPAKRNTRRLFEGGVPLAIASQGGDPLREAELMVEAGVPPLDVIVAATHNGAMALGQLKARGTVETGKRPDLILVSANPGEDIRNLRQVALRMADGEWIH